MHALLLTAALLFPPPDTLKVDYYRPALSEKAAKQLVSLYKSEADKRSFACLYGHVEVGGERKQLSYFMLDSVSAPVRELEKCLRPPFIGAVLFTPHEIFDRNRSMRDMVTLLGSVPEWGLLLEIHNTQKTPGDVVEEIPIAFAVVRTTGKPSEDMKET